MAELVDPVDALIHGSSWQPKTTARLRLYDIAIDEYREPTQVDIDMLVETAQAYGKLRRSVETIQAELMQTIVTIRSRSGLPR